MTDDLTRRSLMKIAGGLCLAGCGADRDGRPDVRASQWPVLVHGVHSYTVLRADPTSSPLTVEFINAAGNRIADSRWSHTF